MGSLLCLSTLFGALISSYCLNRVRESETKKARKALANVLNEGKTPEFCPGTGDDMFEVPLNDDRSYVGPDHETDMLTSETMYVKAAAEPRKASKKSKGRKYGNVKVGPLTEDEDYSFEVEV